MGAFRLVLALAVLIAHVKTVLGASIVNRESLHILVWSGNAVFAFFIISGFYMSLIVNEKYAKLPKGTGRFYLNRALRLYPIHWAVLFIYVGIYLYYGDQSFLIGDDRVPLARWLYAVVSNTFIFGAEVLPLIDEGNWKFVAGPIWTLSLEFYFYLLAPFIVGRSLRTLLVLCGFALAFRLTLYFGGVALLPWRYMFFPATLVFFLMGCLSYRVYVWVQGRRVARWLGAGAAALLFAWVVSPRLWTAPDLDQPSCWAFYIVVGICTPLVFNLTRSWKADNLIGHLSYPVYLSHVPMIEIARRLEEVHIDRGLLAFALTMVVSLVLYALVGLPVERIRVAVGAARSVLPGTMAAGSS